MLKRVLGESDASSEIGDEDNHSHRSDGVRKRESAPGVPEPLDPESARPTRSPSPSPPRRSLQERLEAAAAEAWSLAGGRRTKLQTSDRSRQSKPNKVSTLPSCVRLSHQCFIM